MEDPGTIPAVWFTFVDTSSLTAAWGIPSGNDDLGARVVKYQVELLLLRTVVERAWITDLDTLSYTFRELECTPWKNKKDRSQAKQYRVRVRVWNEFTNAASAAG